MLELSKRDKEWRKIALKITGNKQLADEVVQDMYLALSKHNDKKFNTNYVSYCMAHLYYKMIAKSKETVTIEGYEFQEDKPYELSDEDLILLERYEKISWHKKEIFNEYRKSSIRKVADDFDMNRGFVFSSIKELKEEVING